MKRLLLPAVLLLGIVSQACGEDSPTGVVEIPSVLVTVIDQVDVPAREVGVLSDVLVREGGRVAVGDVLAKIDDTEAELARERAEIEVELAREAAENDIHIRYAAKQLEVANAEMKRANESVLKYRNSVSATELDQVRLTAERAALEVEQAQHEQRAAQLTYKSKRNELALAERNVERRKIISPVNGVVVEVHRKAGEWVQPGEGVFRVLRTDRLQAEGFVPSELADPVLVGRRARLTIDTGEGTVRTHEGKVFFVSPEINPVRGQVRIAADFENTAGTLRPGLKGSLVILPELSATAAEGGSKK